MSIIEKLFSNYTNTFVGRSGTEINGLPKGAKPYGGEIKDSFIDQSDILGTQEHFLIEVEDELYHLRVCDAHNDLDYEAYAVIVFQSGKYEDKDTVNQRFYRMKDYHDKN